MKTWIALLTLAISNMASAQNFWTIEDRLTSVETLQNQARLRSEPENIILDPPNTLKSSTQQQQDLSLTVDLESLKVSLFSLKGSENSYKDIEIPLPNGEFSTYRFIISSIAADELLAKYPNMLTFKGVDINDPKNIGRFDISGQGFRGMFQHDGKLVFIDPKPDSYNSEYISYYSNESTSPSQNFIDEVITPEFTDTLLAHARGRSSDELRTFRLAMTASYKYTQFHSSQINNYFVDPKTAALEEISTLVNRLNLVFQRDLNIKLELIGRQDELIITQESNDPFYSNSSLDLSINQAFIDQTVGNDAYDIGHLLSTQAESGIAGRANLGSVCSTNVKGEGFSGIDTPMSNSTFFSIVAHEIGHQFGAEHTFSSTVNECVNQISHGSAYEPGSGSTLMSYAGSCGVDNLQNASDNYFHSHSIEQITNYISSGNGQCGTSTPSNNSQAVIDAGKDFTIPANTPFILKSTASDSDNDLLTYTWEQLNLDTASPEGILFRSYPPSESPTRYLPKLSSIANSTLTIGESYPATSRVLTFRVTARQIATNSNNQAFGTSYDDVNVTVDAQSGPFRITQPSANSEWDTGQTHTIEWDVANTDLSPVMCSHVDILMSLDNGASFSDLFLERNTLNDGQTTVLIPSDYSAPNSRIILQCSDQRFFTMSTASINLNKQITDEGNQTPFDFSNSKSGSTSLLFLIGLGFILRFKSQHPNRGKR